MLLDGVRNGVATIGFDRSVATNKLDCAGKAGGGLSIDVKADDGCSGVGKRLADRSPYTAGPSANKYNATGVVVSNLPVWSLRQHESVPSFCNKY
jgi:hypothetical protein